MNIVKELASWDFPAAIFRPWRELVRELEGETFGLELEGWLVGEDELPLDAHELFQGGLECSGGRASVDAGYDHVELITETACLDSVVDLLEGLEGQALEKIPGGRILWTNNRLKHPEHPPKWGSQSPRGHLSEALEKERPGKVRLFEGFVTSTAALHLHHGIDPWTRAGVQEINTFNNLAPVLGSVIGNRVGAPRNRNSVYRYWARPERLPAPRWFDGPEHMREFLEGFPRLLTADGSAVDLRTTGVCDAQHLKSAWWLSRPSRHGTAEHRFLMSMPPCVVRLAVWLLMCILVAIRRRKSLPRIPDHIWWEML